MKKKSIYLVLLLGYSSLNAQLLELDYRSPVKKESAFKVKLFRQLMGSVTTLGHIDTSLELMNIDFSASRGLSLGLTVAGTRTFFIGNKDDRRNNLSHLLNPVGGINGSIYFLLPIASQEKSHWRLSSRMGVKWIQGSPLRGFESAFLSGFGQLGAVYQKLLYENAPENQRIDFWAYPQLLLGQVKDRDLWVFFDNDLEPLSYGYGLETGVEFNQKLRLIFLLNQFVNPVRAESVGLPVLRLTVAFRP